MDRRKRRGSVFLRLVTVSLLIIGLHFFSASYIITHLPEKTDFLLLLKVVVLKMALQSINAWLITLILPKIFNNDPLTKRIIAFLGSFLIDFLFMRSVASALVSINPQNGYIERILWKWMPVRKAYQVKCMCDQIEKLSMTGTILCLALWRGLKFYFSTPKSRRGGR